jgi:hypothetical protein
MHGNRDISTFLCWLGSVSSSASCPVDSPYFRDQQLFQGFTKATSIADLAG